MSEASLLPYLAQALASNVCKSLCKSIYPFGHGGDASADGDMLQAAGRTAAYPQACTKTRRRPNRRFYWIGLARNPVEVVMERESVNESRRILDLLKDAN
ncbi:hypothetical protein AJ87_03090 [Rhizobium yanglingense]|nr:hypothetical protein AJ87_03090 [Rhizobium yanglingense]